MKMSSNWQKSIDESILGLFKPENIESLINSMPSLPSLPPMSIPVLPTLPTLPPLPTPTVTFPALSSQMNTIITYAKGNNAIDEATRVIIENIQKFITFFDVSHLPLLTVEQQEYLVANVDLSVRVLMGLGLLEVVPFVLNIVLVKLIFNNVFKVHHIIYYVVYLPHSLTSIFVCRLIRQVST